MSLHSRSISCLLWNISGSPLPVEPCVPGWEGPSNLSCFFTPFMAMGLSSGILNSKHKVKVLVA